MNCDTYCSHGGVCVLSQGHEGLHDSNYCTWADEESISRDEANEKLADVSPLGRALSLLWEAAVPRED